MTSQAEVRALRQSLGQPWPPDDTEESVVGIELHQINIRNLCLGITEVAERRREPDRPPPWQVRSQTLLLGCKRRDGSSYSTMPDAFVYRQATDPYRPSVSLALDGPPILIVEILNPSTYESDLDLESGKGFSYARAGVREYLALDPTGVAVSEGGRAWRLEEGRYVPWEPDAQGRWQSEEIDLAIGLEAAMATVYASDGRRILHEGEVEAELRGRDEAAGRVAAEMERKLAEQAETIEQLRRQLRGSADK
jgi:Uma2 family endonuclease